MQLDFRHQSSGRRSGLKPPPNYASRRVQWKVFILVALLLLVVVLMKEARKAENWRWLWYLQGQAVPATEGEREVDTRARERDGASGQSADLGPLVMGVKTEEPRKGGLPESVALPTTEEGGGDAPRERALTDAWTRLLDGLTDESRQQLLQGLKSARDGAGVAEDERATWLKLVGRLDEGWQSYLREAQTSIEESGEKLTADEQKRWTEIIATLQDCWDAQWRPALLSLAETPAPGEETREALAEVQAGLDGVFLNTIEDNTVFRPTEKDAWFRLLEQLSRLDSAEIRKRSMGSVGFVQLFKQPHAYRGKLVTVKGTVRRGFYRDAPENLYGIAGYYMLWIQPVSVNSPIVIYSLELPEGFPDVRAMEARGDEPELDEEVEVTGFFFKRWAYRAQDGTRLAPLLLAKTATWNRGAAPLAARERLPGAGFWIALLSGTCAFGIIIATGVYWLSRRSAQRPSLRDRLSHASKQGSSP